MSADPLATTDVPVAVALDLPDLDAAERMAASLVGEVAVFKVGLELFAAHGPEVVRRIGQHGPVFLDVKLHDIPNTVERASRVLGRLGLAMVTVHAGGAGPMIAAAVEGVAAGHAEAGLPGEPPVVLAVTVLTSLRSQDLRSVAMPEVGEQVPRLATVAVEAGAQGIVCAPTDAAELRRAVGAGVRLVTPGVRPAGAASDDQSRVSTPAAAIAAGADLLVVGRPITRADDPVAAARAIVAEATGRAAG